MAKQILFVQGAGAGAHDVDAKLTESLAEELGPDYEISFPRMPNEASPNDKEWKRCLAQEINALDDGMSLVGHSAGAATLVSFLAESSPPHRTAGIFLLSMPYIGKGGWEIEGFDLTADVGARLPSHVPVFLY